MKPLVSVLGDEGRKESASSVTKSVPSTPAEPYPSQSGSNRTRTESCLCRRTGGMEEKDSGVEEVSWRWSSGEIQRLGVERQPQ